MAPGTRLPPCCVTLAPDGGAPFLAPPSFLARFCALSFAMSLGALVVITPPSIEPVSLADAKTHLRVNFTDDDNYISGLITTARVRAEAFLSRTLITTTYDLYFDKFPSGSSIALRQPPIQSVTSVKYTDRNGVVRQLTENVDYVVDERNDPGWVLLAENASWPETKETVNAVVIRYVAGYGAAASSVDQRVVLAIKHLVTLWYESRLPIITGTTLARMPHTAEALLRPLRFYEF